MSLKVYPEAPIQLWLTKEAAAESRTMGHFATTTFEAVTNICANDFAAHYFIICPLPPGNKPPHQYQKLKIKHKLQCIKF
jgi:hypothetical protein